MSLTPQLIDAAVERYDREIDRYDKLAAYIGEACRGLLEKHAIRGSVEWRAKDPNRLRAKLLKYLSADEHATEFTDLDSVFRVLKDLAGARITTYVEDDRVRVIALVRERFDGFGVGSQVVPELKDQPFGFYRATHCVVRLKREDAVGRYVNLRGLGCEVQVCSQLAHVFHELEHDLRYKPLSGTLSKKENDLLNALARLMEVGDTIINQTRDAVEARQRERVGVFERPSTAQPPEGLFRNNPFLSVVADSPLLLDLASQVQSSQPLDDLPDTPAALYQAMLRRLVAPPPRDSASRGLADSDELLATLPRIAWGLFHSDAVAYRYDRGGLLVAVAHVTKATEEHATALLSRAMTVGVLVPSASPGDDVHVEFAHPTLRDFLVATHLASQVNRDGWEKAVVEVFRADSGWCLVSVSSILDAEAFDPNWQPVLEFVAGLMNEPLALLNVLADRRRDDHYRHRLGVFCRCYRSLSSSRQSSIASTIAPVFEEVVRIAKRCEHDDEGHRRPWLDWAELLLPSVAGAGALCGALLALQGRYHGWAVSLKVLELFERVLARETVPPSVVELIARVAERDEHQWGANTARLALRLADDSLRGRLVLRFLDVLDASETASAVKVRLAEAIATAGAGGASTRAAEALIRLAQDGSLPFDISDKAIHGLVALFDTNMAPIAAPLLVNHLLNPSSSHHFWLAWRIIGKAETAANSPWSGVFLAIILFSDREDDQRLKLWSAQVLSKHSQLHLRELGEATLLTVAQEKKSHSWAHAARWLVESGPAELAAKGRAALLAEAGNPESENRLVATAELLEMGAIDPRGGPIQDALREAVLRELDEHGRQYGSRLHATAPGVPPGNLDSELFADNPEVVIKLLHTFNGPSFYIRDRDDPNEETRRMRYWKARLLFGTRYWDDVMRSSFEAVNEGADPDRGEAWSIVLFAATGTALVDLLRTSMKPGRAAKRERELLLEELYERGWRLRFRLRQVEVLRKGLEAPRSMTKTA